MLLPAGTAIVDVTVQVMAERREVRVDIEDCAQAGALYLTGVTFVESMPFMYVYLIYKGEPGAGASWATSFLPWASTRF